MGLDMYLEGEKYLFSNRKEMEEGFRLKRKIFELGYWRKHPNLHGYIVNNFAGGVDDCQEIELYAEDLQKIIEAVLDDSLPHTEGFFFGESHSADEQNTVEQIQGAIKWLNTDEDGVSRSVYYRSSW